MTLIQHNATVGATIAVQLAKIRNGSTLVLPASNIFSRLMMRIHPFFQVVCHPVLQCLYETLFYDCRFQPFIPSGSSSTRPNDWPTVRNTFFHSVDLSSRRKKQFHPSLCGWMEVTYQFPLQSGGTSRALPTFLLFSYQFCATRRANKVFLVVVVV